MAEDEKGDDEVAEGEEKGDEDSIRMSSKRMSSTTTAFSSDTLGAIFSAVLMLDSLSYVSPFFSLPKIDARQLNQSAQTHCNQMILKCFF